MFYAVLKYPNNLVMSMRRKIPSMQSLLCFESAAKHASYTHASQELSMTQSAVSRQIQQLEEFLDIQLFTRTRHGMELTVAGTQYYDAIKPYLIGLEKATQEVMSHKGLGGTLKLGVVPTFATRWLLPKLHVFNARYPEITIHLETSTKPFLFNEQMFDAAIYAGTEQQIHHWPGIQTHFLMREDVVAVCSPELIEKYFPNAKKMSPYSYDLTPEQIAQLPLLQQTTRPTIWQEWFEAHHIQHAKADAGQRHELFSMLAVAASHSMGVALIPQMLIEQELHNQALAIASNSLLPSNRAYYLVHSSQAPSPILNKFVDWIQHEVKSISVMNADSTQAIQ